MQHHQRGQIPKRFLPPVGCRRGESGSHRAATEGAAKRTSQQVGLAVEATLATHQPACAPVTPRASPYSHCASFSPKAASRRGSGVAASCPTVSMPSSLITFVRAGGRAVWQVGFAGYLCMNHPAAALLPRPQVKQTRLAPAPPFFLRGRAAWGWTAGPAAQAPPPPAGPCAARACAGFRVGSAGRQAGCVCGLHLNCAGMSSPLRLALPTASRQRHATFRPHPLHSLAISLV